VDEQIISYFVFSWSWKNSNTSPRPLPSSKSIRAPFSMMNHSCFDAARLVFCRHLSGGSICHVRHHCDCFCDINRDRNNDTIASVIAVLHKRSSRTVFPSRTYACSRSTTMLNISEEHSNSPTDPKTRFL
jgi:hypothetical protein